VTSKEFFDFNNKKWWTTNEAGQPIVVVENIPISHVGTDPAQATDMINRTVELPSNLGIKAYAFADALKDVVENTVNFWIKEQEPPPLSDKEKANINGNMPNKIQGELAYKVRSLNGAWATPPYLHNGSVPNIEALLGAAENRPKTFYLGNREYDPVNLGYSIEPLTNGFEFDTSIRGNSNRGHEFTNDEKAYGRVGRALAPEERRALIEYLKTL